MICDKRSLGIVVGLTVVLSVASARAAFTVAEDVNGGLSVLRDGKPLVSRIAVDVGGGTWKGKSSFVRAADGSRVWNRWCEDRDRKFRFEAVERKDGAIELSLVGEVEPPVRERLRALRLEIASGALDGKAFVPAWQAALYGVGEWGRFNSRGFAKQKPLERTTRTELRFSFGEVKPAGRFVLLFDGLKPGAVCAVEVNGQFAGGCIGAPCQLDVTRWLRAGANLIRLSSDVVKQPRLVRLAPAEGPYDLRCEYQTEPIGVVQPRFFWKYAGKRPAKWRLDIAAHPDFGAQNRVYSGETSEHHAEPVCADHCTCDSGTDSRDIREMKVRCVRNTYLDTYIEEDSDRAEDEVTE